jgi:hypothetical protein
MPRSRARAVRQPAFRLSFPAALAAVRRGDGGDTHGAGQRGGERDGPPDPETSRRAAMLSRRQQGPEAVAALAERSGEPRLTADRDLPRPQRIRPARRRRARQHRTEGAVVRDRHECRTGRKGRDRLFERIEAPADDDHPGWCRRDAQHVGSLAHEGHLREGPRRPEDRGRDALLGGRHLDERKAVRVHDQQEVRDPVLLERQDLRQRATHERGPVALRHPVRDGGIVREEPGLAAHVFQGQCHQLAD